MNDIIYRTYESSDLEDVQALMEQLGYGMESRELEANIQAVCKRGGKIFIAEWQGKAAGCVCVLMDARLAEGEYGEIVSLVVTEGLRGKGVGKGLVSRAEEWVFEGCGKIRIRCNALREKSHGFYRDLGYTETKQQKVFIKKKEILTQH